MGSEGLEEGPGQPASSGRIGATLGLVLAQCLPEGGHVTSFYLRFLTCRMRLIIRIAV